MLKMQESFLLNLVDQYQDTKEPPKLSKETIEGLYTFAYHFYKHQKYDESIHFFRFLTFIDTHQKKHWIGLGAAQQMDKKYQDALRSYSVAQLLDEKNPYIQIYSADCFFAQEKIEEGIQALSKAKTLAQKQKKYQKLLPEISLLHKSWKKKRRK